MIIFVFRYEIFSMKFEFLVLYDEFMSYAMSLMIVFFCFFIKKE